MELPKWIQTLIFCWFLQITLGALKDNEKNNDVDQEPWTSQDQTYEEWLDCHAYNFTMCADMKAKLKQLENMVFDNGRRKKPPDKGGTDSHAKVIPTISTAAEGQEVVFFSPDQLQHLMDSHRKRKRRKIEHERGIVGRWDMPIKYRFDGSHTTEQQLKIRQVLDHWESQTCVRFQALTGSNKAVKHILFTAGGGNGCGSYIGQVKINPQPVVLGSRCFRQFGVAVHEIGHVLGFWHEHQRSDRDQYITIDRANALEGFLLITEMLNTGRTVNALPYDYSSVLHYGPKTLSWNGGYTIKTKDPLYQLTMGQRTGLSFLDAKLANMLFCQCVHTLPFHCKRGGYQDRNNCNQCRCPDGFTGHDCSLVATSVGATCGGVLQAAADLNTISSPSYSSFPYYYGIHQQCAWLIQAPPGHNVVLLFRGGFGLYCIDMATCFHWVEVRYTGNLDRVGPRFCCYTKPDAVLRSEGTEMLVLFQSNFTIDASARRGFKAAYYYVSGHEPLPQTAPPEAPGTGQIISSTPGVPHNTQQSPAQPQPTPHVQPPRPKIADPFDCNEIDIVFIMDSSGSVGPSNWPKMLTFAKQVVDRFSVGPSELCVGAVSFGSYATKHFGLNEYNTKEEIFSAIDAIPWRDEMTNTSGGFKVALKEILTLKGGDRPQAPNVLVLITDGESNRDVMQTIPTAEYARSQGATIFVVGVGLNLNMNEIAGITTQPPEDHAFLVHDFNYLQSMESMLENAICRISDSSKLEKSIKVDPAITSTSTTTDKPTTTSTVSSKITSATTPSTTTPSTTTPSTTTTSTTTPSTTTPSWDPDVGSVVPGMADIAFVLDSSGSIGENNWQTVLKFVRSIVSALDIDQGSHKVGVVSFGSYADVEFHLKDYNLLGDLTEAIESIKWKDEMTNTSGGIKVMCASVFNQTKGDRYGVPNIGIIVTDGESNRDRQFVKSAADEARRNRIYLYVIGVGDKVNKEEVEYMANDPQNDYLFMVKDFANLARVQNPLLQSIARKIGVLHISSTSTTKMTTTATTTIATTKTTTATTTSTSTARMTSTTTEGSTSTPNPAPLPCDLRSADIAFILDSSGSIGRNNWYKMLNFCKTIIKRLPVGVDRYLFGGISFGNEASLDMSLGDYTNEKDIINALLQFKWKDQWTNTSGGLWLMQNSLFKTNNGDRPNSPNVAILITDGPSNRDRNQTVLQAQRAKNLGIKLIALGVGNEIDRNELYGIASHPRYRNVFLISSFDSIQTVVGGIIQMICEYAAVPVYPVTQTRTQTTTNPQSSTTKATTPVIPTPDGASACGSFDIAFVLDSSGSIGKGNWRKILNFVKSFVDDFGVSPTQNRIGIITFGNEATLHFGLNYDVTKVHLKETIDVIPFKDQWTNTSGGLTLMRRKLFDFAKGDRDGVPNIGILVTDGKSNRDEHLTIKEADVCKSQGIQLHVVGIGNQIDQNEVTHIASHPPQKYLYHAVNFDALSSVKKNLIDTICNRKVDSSGDTVDDSNGIPIKKSTSEQPVPVGRGPVVTTTTTTTTTTTPRPPTSTLTTTSTTKHPKTTTDHLGTLGWGTWSSCSRNCGGCGQRYRHRICHDGFGTYGNCGDPEIEKCNTRTCSITDNCDYYIGWTRYHIQCTECCDGYFNEGNVCIKR